MHANAKLQSVPQMGILQMAGMGLTLVTSVKPILELRGSMSGCKMCLRWVLHATA